MHTIKAYRTDLAQFAEYVGPQSWSDIDHVLIRGYLSNLYERGLSKTSVARALAALRSLYKWLAQEGEVEQNPAALVATPKLPKKLPRVPTIEEVNTVLDTEMPECSAFSERDQVILELLYGCGIRNSELIGINLDDIHWSQQVVLVRGKGKKERYVPFGDSAAAAVHAYLPARQRVLGETRRTTERALLINLRGSRLTTRSVGRIVKQIAVARGLSPDVHPHTLASRFRHAHAGGGRRPARHPGDARSRAAVDHAALHAAHGQACDGGVRQDASARQEEQWSERRMSTVPAGEQQVPPLRFGRDDTNNKHRSVTQPTKEFCTALFNPARGRARRVGAPEIAYRRGRSSP